VLIQGKPVPAGRRNPDSGRDYAEHGIMECQSACGAIITILLILKRGKDLSLNVLINGAGI